MNPPIDPLHLRLNEIHQDANGDGPILDTWQIGEDIEIPEHAMYMKASIILPAGIPCGPHMANDSLAICHSSSSMGGPRIEVLTSATRPSYNFGAIRRHKDCLRTVGYFSRESFQTLMNDLYATPGLRRTTVGQRWPRKIHVLFIGVLEKRWDPAQGAHVKRYVPVDRHTVPEKNRTAHVLLYWRPPG